MRNARAAAAITGAVLCLGMSIWGVWLVFGARLTAVTGSGPADGVLTVSECHGNHDIGASLLGLDCEGVFAATGSHGPASQDDVVLVGADEDYPAGTRVEVRLTGGAAFEPSPVEFVTYATWAALLLTPGAVACLRLSALAWRGTPPAPGGYALLVFVGGIGVLLLGLVVQLLTSIAVALF
ncbi:hypothetical protein [Streptomyces sp. NPDC127084]|uniref:hypothetical protein n=1 Tax=Streptomyces sp. NPDC127084 TaxID=3347133 RepID=UPI003646C374